MYVNTKWEQYVEASDNGTASQLYASSFEGHFGYFTGKEYSFYLRNIVGSLERLSLCSFLLPKQLTKDVSTVI